MVKEALIRLTPAVDLLMVPFVFLSAWALYLVRRIGIQRLPASKSALIKVGVFPIRNHYYEPRFDFSDSETYRGSRDLPGIDLNVDNQLALLESFTFQDELIQIPQSGTPGSFYYNNPSFKSGDAEYWYQLIRATKPSRIIEIGSGYSTLLAIDAIRKSGSKCEHICVEPFEAPWLDSRVKVVRQKVEDLDVDFFACLEDGDILFIDSSHMIRPGGDVLFEYLHLLPTLKPGVIVHIHDIFTPEDYLQEWLEEDVRFWNEQYLLEAFLTHNADWEIIGALNYLHHHHYEALKRIAPMLTPEREPGSFYIRKRT